MSSNRNALAYDRPRHVPASVPDGQVDAYLDSYPSAHDGGHALQVCETETEHAALSAEMDALPVATYVVVTAVDGLPIDGGEDVDGGLDEARQALHEAAKAMDEHTETAAESVAVLAAMTLARTAAVGTILTLPGGVTLTLALRR